MSAKPFHRPETNGLGVAGFITSLCGLILTCGLLCPVGFLMSFFALFRRPRGFAIAGTIIGAIGSSFWVAVIMIAIFESQADDDHYQASPYAIQETTEELDRYGDSLEQMERRQNRLLSFADIRAKLREEEAEDPWGEFLQVRATAKGQRELYSFGPDGIEDTADDIIRPLTLPKLK